MSQSLLNVIFISIDALRHDRLSLYGYNRPTTPTLDRHREQMLVGNNHFAINASTMGAFPTIMTSTRPLSFGGFDNGVSDRPPSLFSQMQAAGAETYLMSTVHWVNSFYGYGKGIDNEEWLFSLGAMIGTTGALTRTSLERYVAGSMSDDMLLHHIRPIIVSAFKNLRNFAKERIDQQKADRIQFQHTPFYADGFDYRRVLKVLDSHQRAFETDSLAYVRQYMPEPFRATGWLSPVWYRYRQPWRLVDEFLSIVHRKIMLNARDASLHSNRFKKVSRRRITRRSYSENDKHQKRQQAFFVCGRIFLTLICRIVRGLNPNGIKIPDEHLQALGYDADIDPRLTFGSAPKDDKGWHDWSALYDAAVHFVDGAIAQLIAGLKRAGIWDRTVLVLCGDHGEELGENGDISHHFRLYGYNTHVPTIIMGGGVAPAQINGFTTPP